MKLVVVWNYEMTPWSEVKKTRTNNSCSSSGYGAGGCEVIRLTLIKHNMFDKLGAKIWNMDETGIVFEGPD